ncbi:MAG: glycosyltransferase family 25 protein, partial [Candidatus Schmidhempelia sp.]|nr:glycosyltransferase family 25 protein [Candidatus Schmidhempelia sp.]
MKNFVINLPQSVDRKNNVLAQFSQLAIEPNFIEAVNGALLTKNELDNKVINRNYLSPGEIGCALSHLKIYQIMIKEHIPYALIFEDDIQFSPAFTPNILMQLESFIQQIPEHQPHVILLYDTGFKSKQIAKFEDTITINKTVNGFTTHAYLINLQAAKNILTIQSPLKFEIDAWKHYIYLDKLQLNCVIPSLVHQDMKMASIIEQQKGRDFSDTKRQK